jgi:hypothetical protein
MKNILPVAFCILFVAAIQAQVPQLPEILQEKFEQEQLDLTKTYDETENINSEEDYYVYINRDMGVDTLMGYRWNIELEQWDLRARIIETYGTNELLMEKLFQIWTPDSTWLDGLYFQYTYNGLGNLTEMIIQHWRPDSAIWVNHFKKTQDYNADDLLTDINTYWWHWWGEEWIDHHHKIFTYDLQLLVADTVQVFNHVLDEWMDFLYNEFVNNDAGKKVQKTNYRKWWGMGDWHANFRWNYEYESTGEYVTQITGQDWHPFIEDWVDFTRYNYTYDDTGNKTYYLLERWDHFDSAWKEKVQIDYSYNDAGYLAQYIMQHKPMWLGDWVNKKQAFFTYDSEGNMIEKIVQHWNRDVEDWINFEKWEMLLDYKGGLTGIGEDTFSSGIQGFFKNPYPIGTPINFTGLEPGIYSVKLVDVTGRTIESQPYYPGQAITINNAYHHGLHFIILSDDQNILYRGKIILVR